MMERLLVAAVVSALIYIGRLTDISAILAYSIVPLIIAAIGLWFLRGLAFSPFTFDRRLLWKIFAYSFPLFPYVILGYFTTGYLDAVFIAKFISIAELGVYAIALQVNGIALQLPTLANSLLIPLFVTLDKQDESQRTRAFFADVLPTLVLMWGIGCALISFLSYLAIPVFFSAEFYPSAKPLWILLSGSVAAFPVLVGWVALVHSSSKTQVALFAAAATAAVNVAGNFLLIPPLGIVGCAWATALSLLSAATVYGALLRRQVNLIVSWTFLAMAPGFGGALSLTLTDNIFWSLMVCLATSLLIAYLQKDSLLRTISLLISLAKR
jgi:O-antigen/teichoic acid export membrane protein